MSYKKRLDHAFCNAPVLPLTPNTQYVFFSDCHRGIGTNNDNFLKNANSYFAALQYYYQYGFHYIEVGDGDELWESCCLDQIMELHPDVFSLLCQFHQAGRLTLLYGNHDMTKMIPEPQSKNISAQSFSSENFSSESFLYYEGVILRNDFLPLELRVTHGHQADFLNSVCWKLARFLVRHLWTPLEYFGVLDPTSAAKNNTKKQKLEKKYIEYAKNANCLLLTGHTHRPTLGNADSPYYNCGSCVHPKCITCIELCGYRMNLVKWHSCAEKSEHFYHIYKKCPPVYPVYIKREVLGTTLCDNIF